jgi:prefoldin subunit 5
VLFLERDNLGFLVDEAIHIDIGTFVAGDCNRAAQYLKSDFNKLSSLQELLESECPELARYFARAQAQALQDLQS